MVKYKVNLKFEENGKSLNEIIIHVLKIELEKKINKTYNRFNLELPLNYNYDSQMEGRSN